MKHLVKFLFVIFVFTLFSKNVSASVPDTSHYYKPYFVNDCMGNLANNLDLTCLNGGRGANYSELAQPYILPEGESIRINGVGFLGKFYYGAGYMDSYFRNINIYQEGRLILSVPYDTCIVMGGYVGSETFHNIYFEEDLVLTGSFLVSIETFPLDYNPYLHTRMYGKETYCESFNLEDREAYHPLGKMGNEWVKIDDVLFPSMYNPCDTCLRFLYIFPILVPEENDDNEESSLSEVVENSVNVSPNPAKDFVNISCKEMITNIDIKDITGRTLISKQYFDNNIQIDTKSLQQGCYILNIKTNSNSYSEKLIIK
ncbi:MAG: T9SS type A sorting domain-containing protein [Bacteroidales bacterium]|nr:T9SS type A sorting domain-containing protein [Bacteroidales bacterium]